MKRIYLIGLLSLVLLAITGCRIQSGASEESIWNAVEIHQFISWDDMERAFCNEEDEKKNDSYFLGMIQHILNEKQLDPQVDLYKDYTVKTEKGKTELLNLLCNAVQNDTDAVCDESLKYAFSALLNVKNSDNSAYELLDRWIDRIFEGEEKLKEKEMLTSLIVAEADPDTVTYLKNSIKFSNIVIGYKYTSSKKQWVADTVLKALFADGYNVHQIFDQDTVFWKSPDAIKRVYSLYIQAQQKETVKAAISEYVSLFDNGIYGLVWGWCQYYGYLDVDNLSLINVQLLINRYEEDFGNKDGFAHDVLLFEFNRLLSKEERDAVYQFIKTCGCFSSQEIHKLGEKTAYLASLIPENNVVEFEFPKDFSFSERYVILQLDDFWKNRFERVYGNDFHNLKKGYLYCLDTIECVCYQMTSGPVIFGDRESDFEDRIFYFTEQGVFEIDLLGTRIRQLYSAQEKLSQDCMYCIASFSGDEHTLLKTYSGLFYIVDGDNLVEINIASLEHNIVAHNKNITWSYWYICDDAQIILYTVDFKDYEFYLHVVDLTTGKDILYDNYTDACAQLRKYFKMGM